MKCFFAAKGTLTNAKWNWSAENVCVYYMGQESGRRHLSVETIESFKKETSPSGNWTPVSRVTGGDTHHYTNEDFMSDVCLTLIVKYWPD